MPNPRLMERTKPPARRTAARYPGLTRREARAVDAFRKELRAILPNGELVSLYLYGSKPRREANVRSDIDIFLVYTDVTDEQENALQELILEHLTKPPHIHLLEYRADALARANGGNPLIYNVSHHGILLEGAAVPKLEINRRKAADTFREKAHRNLRTAQLALDTDDYDNTISLSYYAAYYAADAALASKGLVAQSHSGTETLLTLHFIRTGLIPNLFKGLLGRGHQARIQADYPKDVVFNRDDAEYWFTRAQEFVSVVDASIETWLAEPPIKM